MKLIIRLCFVHKDKMEAACREEQRADLRKIGQRGERGQEQQTPLWDVLLSDFPKREIKLLAPSPSALALLI